MYMKLFGSQTAEPVLQKEVSALGQQMKQLKGLYIFGSPGCGKTFTMDLFYESLEIEEKKRVHFNEFMLDIHRQMHSAKLEKKDDPLESVAMQQSFRQRLLCLDEFQVTDIADALLLKRLFENMMNQQTLVVMTSNRVPEDLYKNGLQRHVFEPFIPFLRQKCDVIDMDSKIDYRYSFEEQDSPVMPNYMQPIDHSNQAHLRGLYSSLGQQQEELPLTLYPYEGRSIEIANARGGVAMFTFNDICNRTYGSSDFIAIARAFHSICIASIPQITLQDRNVARRFILLIDEMYNNKTKLFCTAQVDISNLFRIDETQDSKTDEYFALKRCLSRLIEMQSKSYR